MNIELITFDNLNCFSERIIHFSSTRFGGVSKKNYASLNLGLYTNDDVDAVAKNRQLLAAKLGIDTSNLINAHQTHGVQVKIVDSNMLNLSVSERESVLHGYDALITNLPDVCVAVTTADCVPVLMYDFDNNAVAAVHSGWRSTLHNIVSVTVSNMQRHYNTNPERLVVAIGPCIGKDVYEVGKEVVDEFAAKNFDTKQVFFPTLTGKYLFDIRKTVAMQLFELNISNIEISSYCTFSNSDLFFSARRQGIDSGRMLSGIMIKKIL